jgi:hypothetical protein
MQGKTREDPSSQPDGFGKISDQEMTQSYLNALWNVVQDATCNPEGTMGYLTQEEAQACQELLEEMSEENAKLRDELKSLQRQVEDLKRVLSLAEDRSGYIVPDRH